MSETVHYKGKIKMICEGEFQIKDELKRLSIVGEIEKYEYECFRDGGNIYNDTYVIIKNKLFEVIEKEDIDLDDEFANIGRTILEDVYEYDIKYYNGGTSFDEVLNDNFNF